MEYWLIRDKDIQEIRKALQLPGHEINDYNCPHPGNDLNLSKCSRCENWKKRKDALHTLESGLHLTNCKPADD